MKRNFLFVIILATLLLFACNRVSSSNSHFLGVEGGDYIGESFFERLEYFIEIDGEFLEINSNYLEKVSTVKPTALNKETMTEAERNLTEFEELQDEILIRSVNHHNDFMADFKLKLNPESEEEKAAYDIFKKVTETQLKTNEVFLDYIESREKKTLEKLVEEIEKNKELRANLKEALEY